MKPYIFFREGMFYPVELRDDDDARANAECNPGTLKVENLLTNEIVWPRVLNAEGSAAENAREPTERGEADT